MMKSLFFIILLFHGVLAQESERKWLTLSGEAPLVVARGGYSGVFPESSQFAYELALSTSLPNVALFCDLQLTKDGAGICRTDLRLDNSTNIEDVFPKGEKTYPVNGDSITGWFSVDYTADDLLERVSLVQNGLSRPTLFDDTLPLTLLDDLRNSKAPKLWLNVQVGHVILVFFSKSGPSIKGKRLGGRRIKYDMFFKAHKLDVATYVMQMANHMVMDYISSPEIGFLKAINGKIARGKTKFIFRFQDVDAIEPSTKKKYGDILKDLSAIKSFASGILVPKTYIWPVNDELYLEPHTTLVGDAHKAGLEVFAYSFANDRPSSYNYSYDPVSEYLNFIDNGQFSVDGVITDFPSTASEAIACFAHYQNNKLESKGRPLIISRDGASGVYPGCTDLAYQKAVDDGVDIIDCSVQMTKDGLPFCLGAPDLIGRTTAVTSFMTRSTSVPEIQSDNGIFSFELTWSEIQSLQPELLSPQLKAGIVRNPAAKNKGKFMTLADFLNFAKDKDVPGILIDIQNAPYLTSKKGLDIIEAVTAALSKAGFDKQTTQQVLIQSDDTAVLSSFKKFPNYKRVLLIPELIGSASKTTADMVKESADIVNIPRGSIISNRLVVLSNYTNVVEEMQAANITVYASSFRNEYSVIAFDFFSDPSMELCTYVKGSGINGVITEFPETASRYLRSPCFNPKKDAEFSMLPIQPGFLLSLAPSDVLPPAAAPPPALTIADIQDPPLPPVRDADSENAAPSEGPRPSGQPSNNVISLALCFLLVGLNFIAWSYH